MPQQLHLCKFDAQCTAIMVWFASAPVAVIGINLAKYKVQIFGMDASGCIVLRRCITKADSPEDGGITERCYAFKEVYSEKIRAMGE